MAHTKSLVAGLIGSVLLLTPVWGAAQGSLSSEKLSAYLAQEIQSIDAAIQHELDSGDHGNSQASSEASDDAYFFRRFWLRLRPRVGIEIPILADFEVIPEVELLWEKETPEGWETYRPRTN